MRPTRPPRRSRYAACAGAFVAAALAAFAPAGTAAAPLPASLPSPPLLLSQAARLSLEQAADRVQRSTGGRVLDARDDGGVYRIKVLTPRGEVRIVLVDPKTGAMR